MSVLCTVQTNKQRKHRTIYSQHPSRPAPDEIVPSLHQYIELLYGIVFQYSIHLANMALLQSGTWVNHASCAGAKSLVLGNAQINVEAHFICEDTCLGYLTSTLRYPSLHVSWII